MLALPQPQPPTVLKASQIPPPNIIDKAKLLVAQHITGELLNLYAWGSRWYGIYTEASDWDFLAVVTGYTQPDVNNVVESEDVDVALFEVNHFQSALQQSFQLLTG